MWACHWRALAGSRSWQTDCHGQGAQVAVDTTLVRPLTRSGEPGPGDEREPGLALQTAANRKRRVAKARGVPARLRAAARQANIHWWTGMLAVAAQRAFALLLLELPLANVQGTSTVQGFQGTQFEVDVYAGSSM